MRKGLPPEGGELAAVIKRQNRRLRMLEMPTGEQLFRALDQVKQLILDLPGLVAAAVTSFLSAGFTTGSMHATGNVQVDGTLTATAGITSPGVALTDITTIPGTRASVWVHNSAYVIGQTSSTLRKKTNLEPTNYTAEQFLSVQPYFFQYKAQVAIRDDPDNVYYDPTYEPQSEVGLMAEHLIDAGLGAFVQYDADGLPANIDYAAFGAIASLVIGKALLAQ